MSEPATHLRAEGKHGLAACGQQADECVLGDSAEGIECRRCRKTEHYRRVHVEEFGEEPEDD